MSPERAQAYRRVTDTLRQLGPSKLQNEEQEAIREAADTLIFCRDLPSDAAALVTMATVERLCHDLIDSRRWERVTAERLLENVAECGPPRPAVLQAA
jgi:hypothetical protein